MELSASYSERVRTKKETISKYADRNTSLELEDECKHSQLDYTMNPPVCISCGIMFEPNLEYNRMIVHFNEIVKEFGNVEKIRTFIGLENDVSGNKFPRDVMECANEYFKDYLQSNKGNRGGLKITRNKPRKSLVFAALYIAFLEKREEDVNPVALAISIGLVDKNRQKPNYKKMGQGIKKLLDVLSIPNRSVIIIEPTHTIYTMMKSYHICTETHMPEIQQLYNYAKYNCSCLERSKPHSVAAALFWFWYCLKREISPNLKLDVKSFAEFTGLCVNTINKLAKSIQESIPYFINNPDKKVISSKKGRRKKI